MARLELSNNEVACELKPVAPSSGTLPLVVDFKDVSKTYDHGLSGQVKKEEIAEVAREAGAEVPFLRPPELAQDASEPMGGSPAAFREFLDAEHAKWVRLVREARIELS